MKIFFLFVVLNVSFHSFCVQGHENGEVYLVSGTNYPTRYISLYWYSNYSLTLRWSTQIEGELKAVSLCDMNDDGDPEIIAQIGALADEIGRPVGSNSVLIYGNIGGSYELVLNATADWGHANRAYMIDYYQNGTEYLITRLNQSMVLIHYNSGLPEIREWLSGGGTLGLGDANDDGMPDILRCWEGMFTVWENMGGGEYVPVTGSDNPWDEIRVGDVTGDGFSDVVIVGNGPQLGVWTRMVDERYKKLWTYSSPGRFHFVESVDLGDLDGDGFIEIVTSTEWGAQDPGSGARGLTIWQIDPQPLNATILSYIFNREWEDTNYLCPINGWLALRVETIDYSGRPKILGCSDNELCIVEWSDEEGKYIYQKIPFPSTQPELTHNKLDVFSTIKISEPLLRIMLVCALLCAYKHIKSPLTPG